MINKEKIVETTKLKVEKTETAIENIIVDNNILKIKLAEYHSVAYLDKLKETAYKGQEVVFILPNGKEYK